MAKPESSNFRRWLVDRVSYSRWPLYQDDTDEKIAERIGVQVEVLREARVVFQDRTKSERTPEGQKLGAPKGFVKKQRDLRYRAMVFLEPPEEIYEEWKAIRERRDLTNSVLLRSAVHYVLQLRTQPAWIATPRRDKWPFRGKWLGQTDIRAHKFRVKTDLTAPVYTALTMRAVHTGVLPAAIARWAMCLVVAGKLEAMPIVSSMNALYKEPRAYCLEPAVI